MACLLLRDERTGGVIFMCGSDELESHPCRDCNCESDFLCDFPVGDDKTCDAQLCTKHAHEVAPGIHYCKSHYDEFKRFEDGGGVKKYLDNVIPYPSKRRAHVI